MHFRACVDLLPAWLGLHSQFTRTEATTITTTVATTTQAERSQSRRMRAAANNGDAAGAAKGLLEEEESGVGEPKELLSTGEVEAPAPANSGKSRVRFSGTVQSGGDDGKCTKV